MYAPLAGNLRLHCRQVMDGEGCAPSRRLDSSSRMWAWSLSIVTAPTLRGLHPVSLQQFIQQTGNHFLRQRSQVPANDAVH